MKYQIRTICVHLSVWCISFEKLDKPTCYPIILEASLSTLGKARARVFSRAARSDATSRTHADHSRASSRGSFAFPHASRVRCASRPTRRAFRPAATIRPRGVPRIFSSRVAREKGLSAFPRSARVCRADRARRARCRPTSQTPASPPASGFSSSTMTRCASASSRRC